MNIDDQKRLICEKLPELIESLEGVNRPNSYRWLEPQPYRPAKNREINWSIEGLKFIMRWTGRHDRQTVGLGH